METKANINLRVGTVDLSGSEQFVSKYLDIFIDLLGQRNDLNPMQKDAENEEESAEIAPHANKSKTPKKSSRPAKAKSIPVEKFDIHKDKENPSLEDFLTQKNPGKTTANIIAVIAYYITFIRGIDTFTEGNIDYAYRTLSIPGRPTHLRQIIINAKNNNDFFEQTEDGKWKLTRTGEIFVDEKLPSKTK